MKLYTKVLSLILVLSSVAPVWAHEQEQAPVVATMPSAVSPCHCVPTEHWFHKTCVKNYNKQFPQADLPENNDTEGLPANVLQAIEMLASDIAFVAQDGTAIIPVLNAKGKLILPMSKNADYVLCKTILHNVDVTTTLTAQELYEQWTQALYVARSAQ